MAEHSATEAEAAAVVPAIQGAVAMSAVATRVAETMEEEATEEEAMVEGVRGVETRAVEATEVDARGVETMGVEAMGAVALGAEKVEGVAEAGSAADRTVSPVGTWEEAMVEAGSSAQDWRCLQRTSWHCTAARECQSVPIAHRNCSSDGQIAS